MQVEIDNSKSYSKPNENCPKCGIPLNMGFTVHNVPKNCEKYITFPYMKIGESMHMECYIQHVMDKVMEKDIKQHVESYPTNKSQADEKINSEK